jgi:hypothetical protein
MVGMLTSAPPPWVVYVGLVTGIIGSMTGISGAVMGFISYQRTKGMKALDLRLVLRRDEADVQAIASGLPALLEKAGRSRLAIAALDGSIESGAIKAWKADLAADKARVSRLLARVPDVQSNHRELLPEQLETKIIDVHRFRAEVDQVHNKYLAELEADERKRSKAK